jgi:ADP-heptose:LPS heptosyltransferase
LKPNDPSAVLPSLPPGAEILILRLRSLGDVVLTTPALAALHQYRPDLRLVVLLQPAFAPVLESNPAVAQILLHQKFLRTARELHRRRFAAVFNQHGGPTSAWLAAASRAPVRVCWAGSQFQSLYNVLVPGPESFYGRAVVHSVEHRMTQFYWTGLPRGPIPPARVYPQSAAVAALQRRMGERGLDAGQPYAVLHPGATFFTRRWDIEKFTDLARWLRAEQGLVPLSILGPGDGEIAAAVRRSLEPQGAVLDSLPLGELIALLAGARLFVGHDTGPSHIAAAAGCPVVMIFGSSSSIRWRPWGAAHRVVQNDFPCNPCRGDRCYAYEQPRCILSVAFEQVREACHALLEAGRASGGMVSGPAARQAPGR